MLAPFTKLFKDESDTGSFCFRFTCAICGMSWNSERVPFSHEGFELPISGELRSLIWESEHRAAYDRAQLEALLHFNRCTQCSRWVCNDCFIVADADHTDLCVECGATQMAISRDMEIWRTGK